MLNLFCFITQLNQEFIMLIGDKLHEIRKSKKITLTELSEKSGVQLATLSRIENKKMVGTLESHMAIAKALGIEVVELYNSVIREQKQIEVSETSRTSDVFTHNEKSSFEILTKNVLSKQMMPTLIKIEQGGTTQPEQAAVNSEKFLFILEGTVEAIVDHKHFRLEKNNTLYFEASLPHKFKNVGRGVAKLLCVTTPVSL
jgi:transcriptional regulator with XRE-family HTH domain